MSTNPPQANFDLPEETGGVTFGRTELIFHEVLDLPPDQREATLHLRCAGDTRLIAELRSLLAACEAEELLGAKLVEESHAAGGSSGRSIGPYRLHSLLGRGGMGAVYLAHRADGQFDQQVAIKLIDLPLATDLFRERFRMERQILAGLVHPYIARMLDGGVSDEGELYLAMEYVDGVSISRFCDSGKLSLRERLALFVKVCGAVQFAHQNLVVHRDLKPDNILIAADGTPRLLDFGTAKLLVPMASDIEGFTRQGLQAYTPQYASPEQVLGNPITTASDIYSLGALLYLLLTGVHAYELKEFTTAEMLRLICQTEPKRPSSVASRSELDADLDAIILKAMRKEPQERYLTADQFAADVQAWLEGLPVSARRGDWRYRATKFIRRNKLPLAAAALLVVTLAVGAAGILWQSRVANIERRRAQARSEDLRQLSNSLLSELDDALKDIPGSTGAQKLLVTRVLEHLDRMAADAHGDRDTALDLIRAYTRLGNVQGNVYDQNLADTAGALASFGKALALAQPLVDANPNDKEALRALATVLEDRGEALSQGTSQQESAASLQSAVRVYERLIALPSPTADLVFEASTANQMLGDALSEDETLADTVAGLVAYRRSLELDMRSAQIDPTYMRARRGIAYARLHIGNVQLEENPAQSLQEFRLAIQTLDALPPAEQTKLPLVRVRGTIIRKEGSALAEMGRYAEAIPLLESDLLSSQKLALDDPKDLRAGGDLQRALNAEAICFEYAADPALPPSTIDRARARQSATPLLDREEKTLKQLIAIAPAELEWPQELASVRVRISALSLHEPGLHEPGLHAPDEETIRASLELLKRSAAMAQASERDLELAIAALLAVQPASLKDPKLAVEFAQRGVTATHRKRAWAFVQLAQALRADGQPDAAVEAAREGLALFPAAKPGDPVIRVKKLLEVERK